MITLNQVYYIRKTFPLEVQELDSLIRSLSISRRDRILSLQEESLVIKDINKIMKFFKDHLKEKDIR